MKNLNSLNIEFTSKEADNKTILKCSRKWTKQELLNNYVDDVDCAELILKYLHDDSCIAEALSVEFWYD